MIASPLAWAAMAAGAVISAGAEGGGSAQEDLAAKIEKSFAAMACMTAKFTQKTENKSFGGARNARGTMALLKPGMMRWEYSEPSPLLIVADGERLWYYDKAANSVSSEPIKGFISANSPALFLAGMEPLSQAFNILGAGAQEGEGTVSLKLEPKGPSGGLKALLLKVDARSYIIKDIIMVDYLGNRNTISFSEADISAVPDKSLFKFTPPPGAEVLPPVKALRP